ncbi:transcriptional regulator, putative, Mar family [Thermosipho africanus TCF52B]|uniref:HTH-type transcriptional regulator SarZ n=1 Tax=Thermosipho africanus (strain TCF52B) TaxID=484019 RepID=B7IEX1_THEAB|nr:MULTISPECIES: MarR family transcriptional regulator [Thermosipho]ACJ74635.1 transcriptional regulator, putative, Mar family [Thermosipho africanus TCF52B]
MNKEDILKTIFSLVVNFVNFFHSNKVFSKMTTNEFYVFVFIALNNNVTMKECSQKLNLSKSTITVIIDKLEQENLVKRIRSRKDRRKIFLILTKKGENIFNKFLEDFNKIVDYTISKIPDNELQIINKGFEYFIKNLGGEKK